MSTLHLRFLVAASTARMSSEGLALALVLLTLERTGSAADAGALLAAATMPQIVLGPALGPLVDRSRSPWTVIATAAIANAAAIAALAVLVGHIPVVAAMGIAVVVAATEPLLTGGLSATAVRTPLAGRAARIQAWDSFAYNIGGLAAPALVTVAAIVGGAAVATSLLAAGSTIAAVALATLRSATAGSMTDGEATPRTARHVRAAVAAIRTSPPLLATTVATTIAQGSLGALTFAAVAAAALNGRDADAAGTIVTAISIGAFVGSAILTSVDLPGRPERIVIASLGVIGVMFMGLGAASWPILIVGASIVGLVDAPLLIGTFGARTTYAPRPVQATVFTVGASAKLGATSIGALVGGVVLDGRATGAGLVAIGACHLLAVAAAFVLVRRRP